MTTNRKYINSMIIIFINHTKRELRVVHGKLNIFQVSIMQINGYWPNKALQLTTKSVAALAFGSTELNRYV